MTEHPDVRCEPRGPSVAMRTYTEHRHAFVNARVPAIFGAKSTRPRRLRGSPIVTGAAPANADASAGTIGQAARRKLRSGSNNRANMSEQRAPRQSLTPVPLKGTSTGIELSLISTTAGTPKAALARMARQGHQQRSRARSPIESQTRQWPQPQ